LKKDPAPGVGGSPSLLLLFASFLRMGLTAFGGPAMVAYIRKRVVGQKHWLDPDSFHAGVALCQAIPGATVMQLAAYIGLKLRGVRGAMCCYLILIGVAPWFDQLRASPWFTRAIDGILCSFVGLLFSVTIGFALNVTWDWPHLAIAASAFTALFFKLDILWVVLVGTAISVFAF